MTKQRYCTISKGSEATWQHKNQEGTTTKQKGIQEQQKIVTHEQTSKQHTTCHGNH